MHLTETSANLLETIAGETLKCKSLLGQTGLTPEMDYEAQPSYIKDKEVNTKSNGDSLCYKTNIVNEWERRAAQRLVIAHGTVKVKG